VKSIAGGEARAQMTVIQNRPGWAIEGPEKERARLAYAILENGHVTYELHPAN